MVQNHEECGIFSYKHDVYPLIDPALHFASETYKDQVVIITGGSTGIGAVAATMYAKAGAKLAIVARRVDKLEKCKSDIEKDVPGAQVLVIAGDISDPDVGKRAVKATADTWGRVDIVVANSAVMAGGAGRFGERNVLKWWYTQEVNVRGTLNIIHSAIPELLKTKGQIVVTTSDLAHSRAPFLADYEVSKHAINRIVEILALDYPEIRMYSVHPGVIPTDGALEFQESVGIKGKVVMPDTVEPPAATFLWLTARNAEFLNGRYVQATWDLNEVLAKKEEIVRENLLVTKLAGPAKST